MIYEGGKVLRMILFGLAMVFSTEDVLGQSACQSMIDNINGIYTYCAETRA